MSKSKGTLEVFPLRDGRTIIVETLPQTAIASALGSLGVPGIPKPCIKIDLGNEKGQVLRDKGFSAELVKKIIASNALYDPTGATTTLVANKGSLFARFASAERGKKANVKEMTKPVIEQIQQNIGVTRFKIPAELKGRETTIPVKSEFKWHSLEIDIGGEGTTAEEIVFCKGIVDRLIEGLAAVDVQAEANKSVDGYEIVTMALDIENAMAAKRTVVNILDVLQSGFHVDSPTDHPDHREGAARSEKVLQERGVDPNQQN